MYKLDVNKLIDAFGGDSSVAQGFTSLGHIITIGAVQVWRHRQQIPRTVCLLLFYELADERGMKFNLRNFVIGEPDAKRKK